MSDSDLHKRLKALITSSQKVLIFSGAGLSTESGISDYRSKGGLWQKFQPVYFQDFLRSEEKRKEYWRAKMALYDQMADARPNKGHDAVVALEHQGQLSGVITQNIDGLHEASGLPATKILNLHGTNRETICLSCSAITPWQDVYKRLKSGEGAPQCLSCGGLLKPNTISFGQNLNPDILDQSQAWSLNCDLCLVLGSTLVVEPAASLPRMAKSHGAALAIITLSSTPLDELADIKIEASIGETLSVVI